MLPSVAAGVAPPASRQPIEPKRRRSPVPRDPRPASRHHALWQPAARSPCPAHLATLFFVRATPDAGFLVGLEGELQARTLHGARSADRRGLSYLVDGRACASRGEEQFGIAGSTSGLVPPTLVVPVEDREPRRRHRRSSADLRGSPQGIRSTQPNHRQPNHRQAAARGRHLRRVRRSFTATPTS